MPQPVFRFAPTPNGYLHLGHAYSALLNQKMAREAGGRLLLRIEDTDQTRARPECVEAIYEDLAWLGLTWETPVRVQNEHFAEYEAALHELWHEDHAFPCFCSRKTMERSGARMNPDGQPLYAGTCRHITRNDAEHRIAHGEAFGWRFKTERTDASFWGDVMVAKPRTGSWYHVAVVVDDAAQGVTHVVRGLDVEPSTSLHKLLQMRLGLPTPHYHHHKLILDEAGQKLSKSVASTSIRSLRAEGMTVKEIRVRLGFAP
jgi:glutamyl-Q tRNA(Asp) synthetase